MIKGQAEVFLSNACPIMAALISRHGPCTLAERQFTPFETLAGSIIAQQLSVKAADTIQKRVLTLVGSETLHAATVLSVSPDDLRACGLSNAKAKYIQTLAEKTLAGELDFDAMVSEPDNEIVIKALTALPGIGRWTAEMFLIFGLNRPDVLALGDVGLQRAARLLYGEDRTLSDIGELWRPHRSTASWYLWRHLDAAPLE